MKYRMYVDEVGNSDLKSSRDPNHRYLSLTGVIIELSYVDIVVQPAIEQLKRKYFGSHPDDPVILHRAELVNKNYPFQSLRDPTVESKFTAEFLALLTNLEYTVITAVIDKQDHLDRYRVWQYDPYHYCLLVLLERYTQWLNRCEGLGDVMAEARGGKEDRRLKASFERVYENGSQYLSAQFFQASLTSKQLKMKSKANNIAGLQIADLVAHPSYKAILARHMNQSLPTNFGGQIAEILEAHKYDRNSRGKIDGWGRKWLP